MSGFDPAWLALREAIDTRARTAMPLQTLSRRPERARPFRILDLATGTGANLRYLAPRIGGSQEWLLTDVDPRLLDALPRCMATWARSAGYALGSSHGSSWIAGPGFHCAFRLLKIDLAHELAHLPIQGRQLVTASALLDLVSERWIENLVALSRAENADVLFALTYDGRIDMQPRLSDDSLIKKLVNRHQRTEKGFGHALGPEAPNITQTALLNHAYRVSRHASDWRVGAHETGLQAGLIEGWADAALETAPQSRATIGAWCAARLTCLSTGTSRLTVGHQDMLGICDRTMPGDNACRSS